MLQDLHQDVRHLNITRHNTIQTSEVKQGVWPGVYTCAVTFTMCCQVGAASVAHTLLYSFTLGFGSYCRSIMLVYSDAAPPSPPHDTLAFSQLGVAHHALVAVNGQLMSHVRGLS